MLEDYLDSTIETVRDPPSADQDAQDTVVAAQSRRPHPCAAE
jgi:hypothetical protein